MPAAILNSLSNSTNTVVEFQSEAGEIQQVATQFETLRPNQNFRPRFNKHRVRNKDRRVGKKYQN